MSDCIGGFTSHQLAFFLPNFAINNSLLSLEWQHRHSPGGRQKKNVIVDEGGGRGGSSEG